MQPDRKALLHSLAIERDQTRLVTTKRKGAMVVLVGVAALGLLVLPSSGENTSSTMEAPNNAGAALARISDRPAGKPATRAPTDDTGADALTASGYVVARRKSTVGSEVTGKITEMYVDEGSFVEKGQLIARLDTVLSTQDLYLAQSRIASAAATVEAAEADLAEAERICDRTALLVQKGASTEAEQTKTRSRVDVLQAQLAQMKAALATARIEAARSQAVVEKASIHAPFAGIVLERSAEPGEMISPMSAGGFTRTGIATIADRASIELEVDVNEAYIKRVHPGQMVEATLDSYPDSKIAAHVKTISPAASREKGTVRVRIALNAPDVRVLPDMAVNVAFVGEPRMAQAGTEIRP